MLIPFRWLWSAVTGTPAERVGGVAPGKKLRAKRPRFIKLPKPRRVAQWDESPAIPTIPIEHVITVQDVPMQPFIGQVIVTIGQPIISVAANPQLGFTRVTVGTGVQGVTAAPNVSRVNVVPEVGLFDYELAALLIA